MMRPPSLARKSVSYSRYQTTVMPAGSCYIKTLTRACCSWRLPCWTHLIEIDAVRGHNFNLRGEVEVVLRFVLGMLHIVVAALPQVVVQWEGPDFRVLLQSLVVVILCLHKWFAIAFKIKKRVNPFSVLARDYIGANVFVYWAGQRIVVLQEGKNPKINSVIWIRIGS